jgi:cation transport ATPase
MNGMSRTSSSATSKIPLFVLMVIFVTLALSFAALIFAVSVFKPDTTESWTLIMLGFLGVLISTYVLFQTRRRLSKLRIAVPPVTTTIECKKCGFKSVREYQRGDYIFKEGEPCQKCNDKMLITAIYKEVKEKEKERFRF